MIRGRHGQVTGATLEVPPNTQGSNQVRMLQTKIASSVQKVQQIRQPGLDSNPQPAGASNPYLPHVIVLETDEGLLFGVALDDGSTPAVAPGEAKLYAVNSTGQILGYFYAKASGKLTIANATQNLYSVLNGLLSDLNTFAVACEASSTDPTLVAAATALAGSITTVSAQLGALLE